MPFQPEILEIRLPEWMEGFLLGRAHCILSIQDRMSLVIEAARGGIIYNSREAPRRR